MSHIKKAMLINASHEEESRVAIALNDYLQELDIESAHKALTKGNIYKGVITKVEPSLQAAFIEYGAARQGFLPLNEVHPDVWKEGADKNADPRKINIKDVLDNRQELLVQVVKEERGNKGAALTTNISLAGRYTVLMPNNARGGISRKLSDEERRAIKQILTHLNVPDNMGLIVRTAGKDQALESLEWDYQYLRRLWDEIRIKGDSAPSPSLIYLEGDLATRAIRDHFTNDIDEIQVDNQEVYARTRAFVHAVLPGKEKIVKLYRGKQPLFRKYGIESQCEEIHHREIRLRSGGSIVIDPTEALTSIDVNSSRATGGKNIDDTALATNLEAAEEVARQLRIRDIGGLVVIDFIDMANRKHGQQVEEMLRKATGLDKARIQLAKISRFGLLEMSRQRFHPSVRESTTEICPRCQGRGSVRTVESMALKMLTRMEDWAERGKKPTLIVQVPSETGEYLMNNKRDHIARIEEIHTIQIILQIKPELMIPHYRIERQWEDDQQKRSEVLEDTTKMRKPVADKRKLSPLKPVVGIPMPQQPQEQNVHPFVAWLLNILDVLTGKAAKKKREEEARKQQAQRKPRSEGSRRRPPRRRNANQNKSKSKDTQDVTTNVGATASNKPQSKDPQPATAPKKEASAAETDQSESQEGKKRRRRRRRRRPAKRDGQESGDQNVQEDVQEATQETASSDVKEVSEEAPKKAPKPRPRRRKPAKPKVTPETDAPTTPASTSSSEMASQDKVAPAKRAKEAPKQSENKKPVVVKTEPSQEAKVKPQPVKAAPAKVNKPVAVKDQPTTAPEKAEPVKAKAVKTTEMPASES